MGIVIWIFPFAIIYWLMGTSFSYVGERKAASHSLPHLWLARAGITLSILPVVVSVGIL